MVRILRLSAPLALLTALVSSCQFQAHAQGAAGVQVTLPPNAGTGPKFRSDTTMPVACTTDLPCQYPVSGGGLKPMCAAAVHCATNHICPFAPKSGCDCYEGQAQACAIDQNGNVTPCSKGANCGIQYCVAASETAAHWSPTCTTIASQ